jgi:hypothetical protein
MNRTIYLHGSNEVMAMFGESGIFYRGRWQDIIVTGIGSDDNIPLSLRKSLVGLVIPTIFSKESIEEQTGTIFPIPKESRLAYSSDVARILNNDGKIDAARILEESAKHPLDMYIFERDIYELI